MEIKIVTFSFLDKSTKSFQKLSLETGSTPEVGSSKMSILGVWTTATAKESLCFIPNGKSFAKLFYTL